MPPKRAAQKAGQKASQKAFEDDYSKLTVPQLKALCKKRGLDAVGKKQELVDTLKEDDDIGGKKVGHVPLVITFRPFYKYMLFTQISRNIYPIAI